MSGRRLSPTFGAYVGRQFVLNFGAVLLMLQGVAEIFDVIELLRRAAVRPEATAGVVLRMAFLKAPELTFQILPFAILFGAIVTFWRLTRTQELVVARAAGMSVWQFMAPVVLTALLIGLFRVMVFSPVASVMLADYQQVEARYLRGYTSLLALSPNGLWLRQAVGDTQEVVHANGITSQGKQGLTLHDVIIFSFQGQDRFVGRIDAAEAVLQKGRWDVFDAWLLAPNKPAVHVAHYSLPTDLTVARIQDSFASPETMSFWELPGFIRMLEHAGFSARRHRLYLQSMLASPLLLVAMVLIAATFSMRPARRGGVGLAITGGVAVGFLLFFLSDLVFALGLNGDLPLLLAAWSPAGISTLLGLASLLHLEDG